MQLQPGLFIKSTALLQDTFFADTTILLTGCNAEGVTGFVVNKPFGRSLHELEEFKYSRPFPLYSGGPVAVEELFFVHRRPDLIGQGAAVGRDIYFGGNFQQAVAGINNGTLTASDLKIFVGYCGWDSGELEAEIAEGSWVVTEEQDAAVFR